MMELEVALLHRVLDGPPSIPGPDTWSAISTAELDQFLASRRTAAKLAPSELLERSPSPAARTPQDAVTDGDGRALLVTFDDGTVDFVEHALPVLEKHGAPCVVFVVTGFATGDLEPFERTLARVVAGLDAFAVAADDHVALNDAHSRILCYEKLRRALKLLPTPERRRRLEDLASRNGVALPEPDGGVFLDWEAIVELDRHPLVTIGAHTRTHPVLAGLNRGEIAEEVQGSKAELERRLGHAVDCFAYPYGAHSLGVRRAVRAAGFSFAFTTRPGTARVDRLPRFTIPRNDLAAHPPAAVTGER